MAKKGRKRSAYKTRSKKLKSCCNPFGKHGIRHNCKKVNHTVIAAAQAINISLNTNQNICSSCRKRIIEKNKKKGTQKIELVDFDVEVTTPMELSGGETTESKVESDHGSNDKIDSSDSSSHSEFEPSIDKMEKIKKLNALLMQLNLETVNTKKLRSTSYAKSVLAQLNNKLSELFGVFDERITEREEIVLQLKGKFAETSDQNDRFRVLSVLPKSWSINRIQSEFQTTHHMALTVKRFVERQGVMCSQSRKIGPRTLPPATIDRVKQFFEDDDISRPCAGKRDYKTYYENMEKVTKQRRLVLMNLREAYEIFCKENNDVKIGFTKFTMCRPPHCILALESYGTHATCVCIYHQNTTLVCDALKRSGICPDLQDFKGFFDLMLCAEAERTNECYLLKCEICPGKSKVQSYLREAFVENEIEEITMKQWINTDGKCFLETITKTTDVFNSEFTSDVTKLVTHDFIARKQQEHLKYRKKHLLIDEAVVICDFAENFSFVIQDEVQGYHWNQQQCTIHPFVIYYREIAGADVKCQSLVIIAESLKHNFCSVYQFQLELFAYLKQKLPRVTKLHFFSDGAGGQYKNRKNFYNLITIKTDYHYDIIWNFFASCHGKNSCDAVGGTLKRNATRASLQRPLRDQIQTAEMLFKWCESNPNTEVDYKFCSNEQYKRLFNQLKHKYDSIQTIEGTRKFHSFEPVATNKIRTKIFSECEESEIFSLLSI